jgi:predicted nucleic acid-binding protein
MADIDRIFLDTNVYIIGAADSESYEAKILNWLGFDESQSAKVEVIISEELIEQILRVSKRLRNKD